MNGPEICTKLSLQYQQFCDFIGDLSLADYQEDLNGTKWNAGKQTEHILRSTKPLILAFTLPSFVLKLVFGKANRPGRSYEALFEKYLSKISKGAGATGRFIPTAVPYERRTDVTKSITSTIERLTRLVAKKTEAELDLLILPHPLLGKVTLREMLYFTIFHVQHHQESIQKIIGSDERTV